MQVVAFTRADCRRPVAPSLLVSSRPDADRILIARLDGTAHRLLHEKADREQAIAELHAITTRTDLLNEAAATSLAIWQQYGRHDGDRVARMLIAAGADEAEVERLASEKRIERA